MAYPKYPNTYKKQIKIGDKDVTIEIGKFSEQASAAVLVTCGETVVHTTVVLGRKIDLGYFPLSVEFAEKLYSAGIIKGSRWVKRDGRPLDEVILKARVIDRSLRPLFPEGVTNEVQVINTVFSFDGVNDPDMLGMLGSTIGLAISEIPFAGPIAGLRVGYNKENDRFTLNPTYDERDESSLDLVVAGSGEAIVMVEAGAREVKEEIVIDALVLAQENLGAICTEIKEIVAEVGKEKIELLSQEQKEETAVIEKLAKEIYAKHATEIKEIVIKKGKLEPSNKDEFRVNLAQELNSAQGEGEEPINDSYITKAVDLLLEKEARQMILEDGVRPDGRKADQIRDIWCEIDVFPRTHGSAIFKRGATQATTITTLADPSRGQLIESIRGERTKYYIHHYAMPPYASGEAGRFGFPKRREIGHGALAEKALQPMIPSQEDFPYTIHVVSEIVSSNGSTSQASVCGSTLSLMAAGVPLKRPVAGIAMGLMTDGDKYIILSDIQGLEDHVGDMDFKVSGTKEGITAIQMDIKLKGIPRKVLEEALAQALTGRMHIMDEMLKVIDKPRTQISQYAPKIEQITIPIDRIGELIGPGGKMIKSIIEKSGAEINVDEDEEKEIGMVNISSPDQEKINLATEIINNMMRVVEIDEEFEGRVTRVEGYGAFVEYLPGKEGLVHVSRMSSEYVGDAHDLVSEGESVHVRIAEIKEDGKIGLSMLTKEQEEVAASGRGGARTNGRDRSNYSRSHSSNRSDRGNYTSGRNRGFNRNSNHGSRPSFRGGRDSRDSGRSGRSSGSDTRRSDSRRSNDGR